MILVVDDDKTIRLSLKLRGEDGGLGQDLFPDQILHALTEKITM